MADPTFTVEYTKNQIATFEQRYSALRIACTQETMSQGGSLVFQVSGSGSASAVTRGSSGQIPYFTTDNTQSTVTLVENHAPFERTGFNIFATQGDMVAVMHDEAVGTLNRAIDDAIIAQLDTATLDTGAAQTASVQMVMHARTILSNNKVDLTNPDMIYGIVSPGFMAYIMQTPEFSSKDYVNVQPFMGPSRRMLRWLGINWIEHPALTGSVGAGSTGVSEKCYLLHRHAIGHAANSKEMKVAVGYDDKQDTSWARASLWHGAKKLQNTGIVQWLHDSSAFAAT